MRRRLDSAGGGTQAGGRRGAVADRVGAMNPVHALQGSAGNRAVASLLSVQRRGALDRLDTTNNTIDEAVWQSILDEIKEEYAADSALAGRLETLYWELKFSDATTAVQVNQQLVDPLNQAHQAASTPRPRAVPQPRPTAQPHADVLAQSKSMDKASKNHAALVPPLIAKWDWDLTTVTQKTDQIFHLAEQEVGGQARNKQGWIYRIDLEGPAQRGTAAQFRLQFGAATYAGLHIQLNQDFGAAFIRQAWTQSFTSGKTVHVHM